MGKGLEKQVYRKHMFGDVLSANAHVGRVPDQSSELVDLQALRRSLIEELDRAVASEQYERAANLRDRLNTLAVGDSGG